MNNKGILRVKLLSIIIFVGILLFFVVPKAINYFKIKEKNDYKRLQKSILMKLGKI